MPERRKKIYLANEPSISLSFRKKGRRINLFMPEKKKTTKTHKKLKPLEEDQKFQAILRIV